jgi:hypothetical protein
MWTENQIVLEFVFERMLTNRDQSKKKMQQKSRKSSITISSSNADKTTILAHVYYTSPNSFTRKK